MNLARKRILVVEDDRAAGEALCAELRGAGAIALGPAPTAFYAQQLLGRRGIDAAVLDTELHGAPVDALADDLIRRGTPVVFALEEGARELPPRFANLPRVTKPCQPDALVAALGEGKSSAPVRAPVPPAPAAPPSPGSLDAKSRLARAASGVMRRADRAAGRTGT